ncbi:MAG: nuclear transport factor 2 family protein [Bacteroidetes Order II. Incertae sedis bacterium]|nr:nuclear transport factor 2 family protein [Bacteroidetes Order II. bacterium]
MKMMKQVSILVFLITFLAPERLLAQTTADSLAIKRTVLDYAEGWYTGDSARMARAVHPKLAKRALIPDRQSGDLSFDDMNAEQLIDATRKGYGRGLPPSQQQKDIIIVEINGNTAIVKLQMRRWYDYLQLMRVNDEWKILNVLWELKPREE